MQLIAEREPGWPRAELIESDTEYVVSIALPGFEACEIELTATARTLLVQARSSRERIDAHKGAVARSNWSTFLSNGVCRRIELPADVRMADAQASVEHGLLTVVAPKAQAGARAPVAQLDIQERAFEVVLARSGRTVRVRADQSIVRALAEHGTFIPTSCEQGTCGTCLTTLLQGEADHRDHFLSKFEHQAGDTIIPCISRAKSSRLVLDI